MTLPTMLDLQQLLPAKGTDATFRGVVLKAIYTGVVAGNAVTAAISGTGPTGQEKEQFFRELQAAGLTITNSGSTFTVGW